MSIGQRLRELRESYGESIREAARRTGVAHVTWSRLERDKVPHAYRATLEKVAQGYGVSLSYLTGGRDHEAGLGSHVRCGGSRQRLMLVLSPAQRIYTTLRFLATRHRDSYSLEQIAKAAGIDVTLLRAYVCGSRPTALPQVLLRRLADGLGKITNLAPEWFWWGGLGTETVTGHGCSRLKGITLSPSRATAGRATVTCPWVQRLTQGVGLPG